jgi:3-methylcrotonyl-CoA carboxylase alpha subunit
VSILFQYGNNEHEIAVREADGTWRVTLDGRELTATVVADGDGRMDVTSQGVRRRIYVARVGDDRWAFVAGRTLRLQCPDPEADAGAAAGAASPDIRAAMPGKVVKILVDAGQEIAFGTPVIIVESMKMETEFTAPVAGVVATIHVAEGETVGQDAPLVDIEPNADAG